MFQRMERPEESRKERIFEIIFEAETFSGKLFDIVLLLFISASVGLVVLESVASVDARYHLALVVLEWLITLLFTVEYGLRVYCVRKPWRYVFSFYGLVDLLSILPPYVAIVWPATKALSALRLLRALRVFRIFRLTEFLRGSSTILLALSRSRDKIVVFLSFITVMVVVLGSVMYAVEGRQPGTTFTDIPTSIYWAVVTLTTVGYGDVAPVTPVGKFISSIVMIIGYGVIAVPTGFITAEVAKLDHQPKPPANTQQCRNCHDDKHADGAKFCKSCGFSLHVD